MIEFKTILENIRKNYQENHTKFGQTSLADFKKRTKWLEMRLSPYHLDKNKNAIILAYWSIFENCDSREKIIEATPVETLLRNLRN